MDLSDNAFFKSWLKALNRKQLSALTAWQEERLSDNPSKDIVTDCIEKKRIIYQEIRRRDENTPKD